LFRLGSDASLGHYSRDSYWSWPAAISPLGAITIHQDAEPT
jgi:hypothetical protein